VTAASWASASPWSASHPRTGSPLSAPAPDLSLRVPSHRRPPQRRLRAAHGSRRGPARL